ncbi:hypothetical protein [Flavobacterium selenitireducens]|uniref:hypothetical protein n=1 Tax=Flavobacterium selenitireducens TaxID=2722704 RepID=UPI00168BE9AE|nr:hypothetical protein [Flavobacterium selenitireducens]MBD3581124.1 hypothetical protein [Flavobacterium selenitireducens]
MKLLLSLFFVFTSVALSAQETRKSQNRKATTETNVKSDNSKKASSKTKKKETRARAGKTDPNEKGSGLTIPAVDQPNLDARPNPAATVPSTVNPADMRPTP